MSVSQKKFLAHLETVDFVWAPSIELDWPAALRECEVFARQYPGYAWSLVDKDVNSWGEYQALRDALDLNRQYGYTKDNTQSWKTTCGQPALHMPWEDRLVSQLPLTLTTNAPTLQKPGWCMPWHMDRFFYHQYTHGAIGNVVRFITFVKDWEPGHMLQVGQSTVTHWRAGQCMIWHPRRWHLSGNLGLTDKWTCNTTGVLQDMVDIDIG